MNERLQARRLRASEGYSIREIASTLGVSRSSVSRWVRDIQLTDEQVARLVERNPIVSPARNGSRLRAERHREARRAAQERGREMARSDPRFCALCMLHWAEGSKSRNSFVFTNADPSMLQFVVRTLRSSFELEPGAFTVYCNLFIDLVEVQADVERFWLDTLGLPPSALRASTINRYSSRSKRQRARRLPYGTCRIAVHSTRVIQTVYGGIQEIGGFERPDWLDC